MLAKILIGSGILMIAVNVAAIVWKIYDSLGIFSEPESAGIGAVGGTLISVVLLPIGIILIIIGGAVRYFKNARTLK